MPIEGDLLLQPPDRELARMRKLTRFGLGRVCLGQFEPEGFGRRFDLGQVGGRTHFPLTCLRQLRARGLDGRAERAIARGELHLLPAPQFLPQAAIAACLRGLPLQHTALLLHFEDDVVDAGQVLLGGFELELGGSTPALVLGDPGCLFDQLPAIGGPGAQNLADLALLDHRIALDADACVHQQVLDVLQPADLAIDQVLALARSIQTAHQLNVANNERGLVLEESHGGRREQALGGHLGVDASNGMNVPVVVTIAIVPVAVAIAVAVAVALVPVPTLRLSGTARGDPTQLEADFGGGRRLACVASAEDHVFHAIAAEALRTLLTEHPREGVHDVALPAPVRTHDRGDPGIECQLGSIRKALEAGNLEAIQSHDVQVPFPCCNEKSRSHTGCGRIGCGSGWGRFGTVDCFSSRDA